MTKVRYIFWDSDNTLVETGAHHWRKHFETLKAHGIALGDQCRERIYTNNGAQNWEWISAELDLKLSKEDYLNEIDRWYFAYIGEIGIRPGVVEAIELFDKAGIPQAVVSNGRHRSVMSALDGRQLSSRFKFILCKEDYEGRKPGPEPYLAAKTKMQQVLGHAIDASECLVIEDDPKGVESGKAAGMRVIHRAPEDNDVQKFLNACRSYL